MNEVGSHENALLFGDLSFSSASPLKIAAWETGGEVAGIKKRQNKLSLP